MAGLVAAPVVEGGRPERTAQARHCFWQSTLNESLDTSDMMVGPSDAAPTTMRAFSLVFALLLLQFGPLPSPSDQLYARFGNYLESLRTQAGIPGMSAAIVGANDIIWERSFGLQDVARGIATRPDTPFHLDGLTQVFTATLVLRCVEEGRLALDDTISQFDGDNPERDATVGELLAHTSDGTFVYRPERLDPMTTVVRHCTGDSYRETLASLFDRFAMKDSVPGPDVVQLVPPAEGVPEPPAAERYASVLERLAVPYAVPAPGVAAASEYGARTLTPASGVISTVRDFAQFDVALRQGLLVGPASLEQAWSRQTPGRPHGLGWFVQTYNGVTVVWQFGASETSSSFVLSVPARGLTLVMLANSAGLVRPFALSNGDVMASPFARVFLGLVFP